MKKLLLGALLLLSVIGCQTKEEKLISDCEVNLIKNLKDPSSYEKINTSIIDTVTSLERFTDNLAYSKELYEEMKEMGVTSAAIVDSYGNYTSVIDSTNIKFYKEDLKDDLKKLDSVKNSKNPNRVLKIIVEFKYRAKNSFGALDIQKSTVTFLPEPDYFKKSKDECYSVHSEK